MPRGLPRAAVTLVIVSVLWSARCDSPIAPTPKDCTFTVSPTTRAFESAGGEGVVEVDASRDECQWAAWSDTAWVTVQNGQQRNGVGQVRYAVAPNSAATARTAVVAVATARHTVTQAAACNYTLTPDRITVGADAASGTFRVNTADTCAWTAVSSAAWITVTNGSPGRGTGSVSFSVTPNGTSAERSGAITVDGVAVLITQAGQPLVCTFVFEPDHATVGNGGDVGLFRVMTRDGCTWTPVSSVAWITITLGWSGSGGGSVSYIVAPNDATTERTGTIVVAGQPFRVTQAGQPPTPCTYALAPERASIGSDGGTGTFRVTTPDPCGWTANSSTAWLTVAPDTGRGPATVSYAAGRNDVTTERTGTITVAGVTFTLTQAGRPAVLCDYAVSPVAFSPCMANGTLVSRLDVADTCSWTMASTVPWLTIRSGAAGSGAREIRIDYADNYDRPRAGVVEVRWPSPTAGQNIHVSQAGCYYAVSTSAVSVPASGGAVTFEVLQQSDPTTCGGATQDRCLWSATSDTAWIVVTSSMPRFGDDRVQLTILPNPGPSSRVGSVTVRDQRVQITQAGP